MTDVKHIRKLKNIIHEYDLEAPEGFYLLSVKELSSIYNGAGPDWIGDWGREKLTSRLDLFEAAFLVHDFEYACSDHTEEGFEEANKRMWQNMRKIIFGIYSWHKISDWDNIAYWLVKAFAAYRACARLGWSAWLD
ncbi:MAG: hypothetical protein GY750_16135 [Lentisphaerae bacterium]|nr:hypothetical protein [Lentisphaerota bacterium]MCP4102925.1 hypothetical protein [Lentisphaerota bacterium]